MTLFLGVTAETRVLMCTPVGFPVKSDIHSESANSGYIAKFAKISVVADTRISL